MTSLSKIGVALAGMYVLLCIYFIATQGLFGESFIALILGLPWSMVFSLFEFGNASGALLYVMMIAPMVLNAIIFYGIGAVVGKMKKKY